MDEESWVTVTRVGFVVSNVEILGIFGMNAPNGKTKINKQT